MVFSQNIKIKSPHSGDTWYKGQTYTITWTKTGTMNSNVKIRLIQNGTKILGITDLTPNNGTFNWPIPANLVSGTYYIRVKTIDNAVYDDGEEFTITNVVNPPVNTIRITNPHGEVTWALNSRNMIQWTYEGSGNIVIQLYQSCSPVGTIYDGPNTGSFNWIIDKYLNGSSITRGSYKLRVSSKDTPSVYDEVDLTVKGESHISYKDSFLSSSLKEIDFTVGEHQYNPSRKLLLFEVKSSVPYQGKINYVVFMESTLVSRRQNAKITGEVNFNNETRKTVELNIYRYLPASLYWCYKVIFIVNDKQAGANIVPEKTHFNNSSEGFICNRKKVSFEDLKIRLIKNREYYWKPIPRKTEII